MASSTEPLLKLEQMADGENDNSWGAKTNTNLALLANAIAKRQTLSLGSSPVTLTDTQFADNQARCLALDMSGTLTAAVAVTIPSRSKMYIVRNATSGSFAVTVGASGGTYATVPQSATSIIWCDGTDTILIASNQSSGPIDAATLDGYDSSAFARLALSQSWTAGQAVTFSQVSDAATLSVDCALSNKFYATIAGNRTVSLSNAKDGQEIEFWVIQDGTGGRTLTWPANVLFYGGVPTLSTAASAIDTIKMTYHLALNKWIAEAFVGSSSSAGSSVLTLSVNESNVDVYRRLGSPAGAVTRSILVSSGVIISSASPLEPAMDFSGGFAAGSTLNVLNLGFIIGRGGNGADGGWVHDSGDTDAAVGYMSAGEAGGDAIKGAGVSVTINITNASGRIWGGGGGGGAGGVSADDGGIAVSAGGGGGAGMGAGGRGARGKRRGNLDAVSATSGSNGRLGLSGSAANGTAGTGASASNGHVGASGDGGDYGASGSNGTAETTGTSMQLAATNGGAAGKAVNVNGSTVSFVSGSGSPNVKGAVS